MKQITTLVLFLTAAASTRAQSILDLQPSPTNAVEAVVSSSTPTASPSTTTTSLVGAYLLVNGNPHAWRTFFKFDYSALPANSIIDSAVLSLYAHKMSSFGTSGAPTAGTGNEGLVYRVTTAWTPTTLTWNNQPLFTNLNGALLPQPTSDTQSYPRIVVTQMVKDQRLNGNYGFVLKLLGETFYDNSLIFHSSRSATVASRPRLRIYYRSSADVPPLATERDACLLSPNPATSYIDLRFADGEVAEGMTAKVMDVTGRAVIVQAVDRQTSRVDVASLPRGVYQVELVKNNQRIGSHPVALQ